MLGKSKDEDIDDTRDLLPFDGTKDSFFFSLMSKAEAAEVDINSAIQERKQVGFLSDFFLGEDSNLIANWNKHYQTDDSKVNAGKAKLRLSYMKEPGYKIPNDAISAIKIAATNFEGDGGFSKKDLIDSLTKIGQIETQYKTKIQRGNNPEIENFYASSYWQIEVETAKDLLENSSAIFGEKFEKSFVKYKNNDRTVRESLLSLKNKDLVDLLRKDDALAANIAASLIVTRFNTEET
tara:strand:+ start:1 stop:711 length:711 start_codon:yes stop_codon:yes gene_type:complete